MEEISSVIDLIFWVTFSTSWKLSSESALTSCALSMELLNDFSASSKVEERRETLSIIFSAEVRIWRKFLLVSSPWATPSSTFSSAPFIFSTASLVSFWISLTKAAIFLAASPASPANFLTSSATTANPRPASPARAASIAAFRAKRLVCSAIPDIRSTIFPTSWERPSKVAIDWATSWVACEIERILSSKVESNCSPFWAIFRFSSDSWIASVITFWVEDKASRLRERAFCISCKSSKFFAVDWWIVSTFCTMSSASLFTFSISTLCSVEPWAIWEIVLAISSVALETSSMEEESSSEEAARVEEVLIILVTNSRICSSILRKAELNLPTSSWVFISSTSWFKSPFATFWTTAVIFSRGRAKEEVIARDTKTTIMAVITTIIRIKLTIAFAGATTSV